MRQKRGALLGDVFASALFLWERRLRSTFILRPESARSATLSITIPASRRRNCSNVGLLS